MSPSCWAGISRVAPALPPIASLLPHRPPMILLDEVVSWDGAILVAALTIRPETMFLEAEGVPAHIGVEYMAQACGAYAGAQALDSGREVRIGFLLGTRRYVAHRPWYRLGERLTVTASLVYADEAMANFDVRIEVSGALAAAAQLTVYQPDPDAVGGEPAP
jgi:predicted hotdog family 3-hydroxylacyl-ACP dehydratase